MRSILITGAGAGIGRATARLFLAEGWEVTLLGRRRETLEETAQGHTARILPCDVGDPAQVEAAFAHLTRLDVLFNNAGIMESGPVAELPPEIVRRIFDTNVFAALEMAQGAAKKFIKARAGRIVWTSSVAGLVKVPWDGAYSASKYAVEGFCAALREELAPYGVQVCTVNPGAYRTGFNDTGMESQDQWWGQGERVMAHWPVRELTRQADPAEMIAAMIGVITAEHPPYRTVLPKAAEDMARREQAEEWDKRL